MKATATRQAGVGEQQSATTAAREPPPRLHRACACESTGTPCASCAEDGTATIHRDAEGAVTSAAAGERVRVALADGGRPLSDATRAGFETALAHRFGDMRVAPHSGEASAQRFRVSERGDPHEREAEAVADSISRQADAAGGTAGPRLDLSHVRIHAGSAAATAAHAVGARAFTVGDHVVFGAGGFAPQTSAGRKLLAHELTHVVRGADGEGSWLQRDQTGSQQQAPQQQGPQPLTPADDCENRLDYTVDFKRFMRDAHKIVRAMPDLTKKQQDDLIAMADYVFAPEGAADINQYKILSCSRIHSTLNSPNETIKGQVDPAKKELRIVRSLADDMEALIDGTSTDQGKFVELLRIFAHEMRHISLGSLMDAKLSGVKENSWDPQRKQQLISYRAEEILADVEELAVARMALGPDFEVSDAEQLELYRSANMIRNWAKPEEWQRLRTIILNELRKRYGPRKGDCDTSLTLGVMRVLDRGGWFWCDMGPRRVIGDIPQGVKLCEDKKGEHAACPQRK